MEARPVGRDLNAAISHAMVRVLSDHTGRGPTNSRTIVKDDVVLVVLEQALTKVERTLLARGEEEAVRGIRQAIQRTMRGDCSAAIERLTGRTVRAFLSDSHSDPDYMVEVFILAPLPEAAGAPAG